MPLAILDATGNPIYISTASGDGSIGNPYVMNKHITGDITVTSGNITVDGGDIHAIIDSGTVDAVVSGTVTVSEGKTGKFYKEIQPSLVLTTSAYATNDSIGGRLTITDAARVNGGTGRIKSLLLYDKEQKHGDYDFLVFNADPTAWTITDNSPINAVASDAAKFRALIGNEREWMDYGSHGILYLPLDIGFQCAGGSKDLTMALVTRGTPTFTSTSSLVLTLGIEQD